MLVLLRGRAELLHFDQDGRLLSRAEMNVDETIAQIPRGEWHGIIVPASFTADRRACRYGAILPAPSHPTQQSVARS
jgi:hypothetical protein